MASILDAERATRMLSTPAEIRGAFLDAVGDAADVVVAVAWARSGWALDQLEESGARVRSLVGVSFGMTTPDALDRLAACGDAWVRENDPRCLFHPKGYLFRRSNGSARLLIGSMNLTRAAFMTNCEAGVLLELDAAQADSWMEAWEAWKSQGVRATKAWREEYAAAYRPPTRGPAAEIAQAEDLASLEPARNAPDTTLPELLSMSWAGYERRLWEGAKRFTPDALRDKRHSYLLTLRETRPIVARPFPDSGTDDFYKIIGMNPRGKGVDCGWFGRLSGNGAAWKELGENSSLRRQLDRLIPALRATAEERALISTAKDLWIAVTRVDRLRAAVVTRLLTLARPDRFFSVNGASEKGLSTLLDIPASHLRNWDGYHESLTRLWSSPWFCSSPPVDSASRELWDARVALLDVLVYEP